MNAFKQGAVMALGGAAALAVLGAVAIGGTASYSYFSTDHERLALLKNVELMCRNGRGNFREPPDHLGPLRAIQYIEAQEDGMRECGEARLRLISYDMNFDPSE